MLQLSTLYRDFLALLNNNKVKYLLVGGYAVQYHGYARPTRDLDIWIARDSENARKMVETFQEFGLAIPELTSERFQQERRIIRIEFSPTIVEVLDPIIGQAPALLQRYQAGSSQQIEILTVQSGPDFEACYADRIVVVIDGVPVNIVSLDGLKAIKEATDRPGDVKDLLNIRYRR